MFSVDKDKYFPACVQAQEQVLDRLPAGMYRFEVEEGMFYRRPMFIQEKFREGLIELKGEPFTRIEQTLYNFFSTRTVEIYKATESRHFIGALLYGPPGTGKTCFIDILCKKFTESHSCLVLRIREYKHVLDLKKIISTIRGNDESIMVIVVLEEFDRIMYGDDSNGQRYYSEMAMINFCDGYDTPPNVLVIMTTNHIEKIPDSLKKRPSRFSIVEEIDSIPVEIATQIVKKFIPPQYTELINVAELSYKVTEKKIRIDQIKYIILNVLCAGMSVDDALEYVTKTLVPSVV